MPTGTRRSRLHTVHPLPLIRLKNQLDKLCPESARNRVDIGLDPRRRSFEVAPTPKFGDEFKSSNVEGTKSPKTYTDISQADIAVCLSVRMSTRMCLYASTNISVHTSTHMSAHMPLLVSTGMRTHMSVHACLSTCRCTCPYTHTFVHMSIIISAHLSIHMYLHVLYAQAFSQPDMLFGLTFPKQSNIDSYIEQLWRT